MKLETLQDLETIIQFAKTYNLESIEVDNIKIITRKTEQTTFETSTTIQKQLTPDEKLDELLFYSA